MLFRYLLVVCCFLLGDTDNVLQIVNSSAGSLDDLSEAHGALLIACLQVSAVLFI